MTKKKCYIIGGGLASLATAAYLIRDGGVHGGDITVLEENGMTGGSLDAVRIAAGDGYVMRGYRMLEGKVYSCLYDLLSFIPSLNAPGRTVLQEFEEFNARLKINASARLLAGGKALPPFPFDLTWGDRLKVLWFLLLPETALGSRKIEDYFAASFFASNFWVQLCTTFSFQPWHSLAEFRRYILRFYHDAPLLGSMQCVQLAPSNEYEAIVLPLTEWLKARGVNFVLNIKVVDLDFSGARGARAVERIHYIGAAGRCGIEVGGDDQVFATLGSITSNSTMGSMDEAPGPCAKERDSSWVLWEHISRKVPGLGVPSVFSGDTGKSKWVSFTITFRDPAFPGLLAALTGRRTGTAGVVTVKDSNWLLSFAMAPSAYFKGQPDHVNVCWGYGLFPERPGNYVKKKLSECTGREVLTELSSHLGFHGELGRIVETSTCIPCAMPYVTSQFLPRAKGNRPEVAPRHITNLALLGQYCELPDDIVFTLEYSVRSAQTAVYSRLKSGRKVTPVYKGYRNPRHIWGTLRTMLARKKA